MNLVVTLGFEEKYALRALMRSSLGRGDRFIIILPDDKHPRREKAYNFIVEEIVKKVFPELEVERVEVNVRDFYGAIHRIRELLKGLKGKIVLNVSGGLKILILEVLAAASSLGLEDAEVEIEDIDSEDIDVREAPFVRAPLKVMYPVKLDDSDLEILRKAREKGELTLKEATEEFGAPKATLWRRLNRLVEHGLLEKADDTYHLSELGRSRI